jgi:hypothetical protein
LCMVFGGNHRLASVPDFGTIFATLLATSGLRPRRMQQDRNMRPATVRKIQTDPRQ